jgi:hypothetical protein
MSKPRVYTVAFAAIYEAYINKAQRKGRTAVEVNQIIEWLTGYDQTALEAQLVAKVSLETFFEQAPSFHANASLITGKVCGVQVETVSEKLMWQIRCLDKLIDELAKGRPMAKILRS